MPGQFDRYNMRRQVSITANIYDEDLGSVADEVQAAIKRAGKPPEGARIEIRGQIVPMNEMMSGLSVGFVVAILVVFLVLTANFQSVRLALAAISTVPAVIAGVLLMLSLTGTTLNIQSFIGSIMAIGVAMANAILLITFAEHMSSRGSQRVGCRDCRSGQPDAGRVDDQLCDDWRHVADGIGTWRGRSTERAAGARRDRWAVGCHRGHAFHFAQCLRHHPRTREIHVCIAGPDRSAQSAVHVRCSRPSGRPGRPGMTDRFVTLAAYLTLATLLAATMGCRDNASTTKQNAGTAALERVVVGRPVRKTLMLSTTQPGRIEAFEETPLFAKVAGYVDNVMADIGDVVRKDQTLVKLSIPELVDELEQKDALVAQAEAEFEQSQSAVAAAVAAAETAKSRIAEAEAGITRTEAENDRWTSEHSRIKELVSKGAVTKKLEDETLNQLRSAEAAKREAVAKLQSSRAGYYEAQANIGKARADQGAAEAHLRVAKAELARANTMLAYTEIKAPYDGIVTRREVNTGHFVQPASAGDAKPLLVVARTDEVRVFIDVPEMEAPYVDADDQALVKVQALPTHQFDANVVRTSWSLIELNHSLRAEVDVPNSHGLLRPGMYAAVTIRLDERPDALTLPATAVVHDGAAAYCMCVVAGRIEKKAIEIGIRSGGDVEVVSGLDENSVVVLKEPETLKEGQQVLVAPTAK